MIIVAAFLNIIGKYMLYCYKVRVGSQIKGLAANAANHVEMRKTYTLSMRLRCSYEYKSRLCMPLLVLYIYHTIILIGKCPNA